MTIHLSILIFWPLVFGVAGALVPRSAAPVFALVGSLVPLGYAILILLDFDPSAPGLQYLTTTPGSRTSASTTGSASTGSTSGWWR
jgi:NADH-quinone oxidoreductase subunit M